MGYDLNRLRSLHKLSEMLDLLNEEYPKLDKPLLSKCMNDGYGVQLKPEAMKTLRQRFDPEGWEARRERDRHKLPCSVRGRLTREELEEFTAQYRSDGYKDANDWVRTAVLRYIGRYSEHDQKIMRELIEEDQREQSKAYWNNLKEET